MFARILVPLDGSKLAEDILVPVESIASKLNSRVILLHVLESDPPTNVHGEHHVIDAAEGAGYLGEIAKRLQARNIRVDLHVHDRSVGDVAAAIDAHAHEYGADLIAMCKHGRSGIRQMIVGGIAQQILRGGGTPILLRTPKPEEAAASTFEPKEILLPLDAGHDADAALAAARTFASAYGARVTLLTAIPSLVEARQENVAARLLPRATAARLRMEQEDAEGRLQTQAGDLLGADIDAVFVVPEGDAEATILRYASEKDADLIILSTHARSGFEAWYTGSTGYRVIAHATQTLLLIREL